MVSDQSINQSINHNTQNYCIKTTMTCENSINQSLIDQSIGDDNDDDDD